ncbi:MAG: hypothetical protein AVDCRST_MAG18-1807, partial [uncultured Thermomicrobiales bacterium]
GRALVRDRYRYPPGPRRPARPRFPAGAVAHALRERESRAGRPGLLESEWGDARGCRDRGWPADRGRPAPPDRAFHRAVRDRVRGAQPGWEPALRPLPGARLRRGGLHGNERRPRQRLAPRRPAPADLADRLADRSPTGR